MGTLPCVYWADLGVYDVHRTFAITLAGFMMRLSRIHWSTLTRSVCKSCIGQWDRNSKPQTKTSETKLGNALLGLWPDSVAL